MALGLLVEVAYEHDEEFRQHLPQVGIVLVCDRRPGCGRQGPRPPLGMQPPWLAALQLLLDGARLPRPPRSCCTCA